MSFEMRTTCPDRSNLYYVQTAHRGWSPCVLGKYSSGARSTGGWVLPNCVGYAVGRFNEIGGYRSCKYLKSVNAENMIEEAKAQGLTVGDIPQVGACMVWQRGSTLGESDGAGHVAIVEKVISDTEVFTSESGWEGSEFYTKTRKKGNNGLWHDTDRYSKFRGFIYHPDVKGSNPNSTVDQVAAGFLNTSTVDGTTSSTDAGNVTNYNSDNSKYSVIDVSYCQPNMDWSKVKSSSVKCATSKASLKPVKGAIIRVGYNGKDYNKDSWVDYHIAGCVANNIPFGLYWYVQNYATAPTSWGEGIAKYMLNFYNGLSGKAKALCKFPLYLDIEDPKYTSTTYDSVNALLASSYCKYILKNGNGLVPGVYAAAGHCVSYINMVGELIDANPVDFSYTDASGNRQTKTIHKGDLLYSKWLARWQTGTNKTLLSGNYKNINPPITLWQQFGYGYDKSGNVTGAPAQISCYNGYVDMSNCFIDYSKATVPAPVSKIETSDISTETSVGTPFVIYFVDVSGTHYYVKAKNITNATTQINGYTDEPYKKAVEITNALSEATVFYIGKTNTSTYLFYVDSEGNKQMLWVSSELMEMPSKTGLAGLPLPGFNAFFAAESQQNANSETANSFVINANSDKIQWSVGGKNVQLQLVQKVKSDIVPPFAATASCVSTRTASLARVILAGSSGGNSYESTVGSGNVNSMTVEDLLNVNDSIARELVIGCVEDYYTIDFDDYKDKPSEKDEASGEYTFISIEDFKAALEDLRGLLSQAIIPIETANTMVERVSRLFELLQPKDTKENLDEYKSVVDAYATEKDTIDALELSDYTEATAAEVRTALAAAEYLPTPEKDANGNAIYDAVLKTSLNSYRLSEFKKHTKALESARKNLELKELDKDAEVTCTVNGQECSMSFNKLCDVIKNIKKEDFTEASYNTLTAEYLNADTSQMGQSELSALITAGLSFIAGMTPVLADCTEFFRARLRAAVRRDYANESRNESRYSTIIPEDKTTWSNFDKQDGNAEGYVTRYTAASREPVDSLCTIFDTFVNIDSTKITSDFPELNKNAPICLQSEVNQLTLELNTAVDNLVTEISSVADKYTDAYSELAEYTHSIGIEATAKIILYGLLETLYTSDLSTANEESLKSFISDIKAALADIKNGSISDPSTGQEVLLYVSADYSVLTDLLLIVKTYDKRRFTESSFNNLEAVVAKVKVDTNYEKGPRKTFEEQDLIDKAVEELRLAMNSLEMNEDPLVLIFTKNTKAASPESPNVALNVKDKILKDNIDVVISVYTEGKLYYVDTVDQLKRDLSLNTDVYFKLRSFYKNNISSAKIEDWTYTYYVDDNGTLTATEKTIEICYGRVYRKTSDGSIEVWAPGNIINT